MSHSLSALCVLAGDGLLWAALLVQAFYLLGSKCCKQRKYMCEISVCFHDEQKVCGHDYFSQFSASSLLHLSDAKQHRDTDQKLADF